MHFSVSQKHRILGALLLCALIGVAFQGVVHNGFIRYDDQDYVTTNPHVLGGLTWANVKWAFTTRYLSNWNPLTWLSHMLDVQLFGVNPHWHHFVSLLLHIVNAVALFVLLDRMTATPWRSLAVAAFFALHPLHVESVAWASERKDLLSGLFFILTLYAYVRYAELRSQKPPRFDAPTLSRPHASTLPRTWYILALCLYALGLMSKPMLVTLPFVLLLLDYWPLARLSPEAGNAPGGNLKRLLLEKVPFLVLAAGSAVITLLSQQEYSVFGKLPLHVRAATAVVNCLEYLRKTVWPSDLAVFYPDPNARYFAPQQAPPYPASELWPAWQIIAAAMLLAAVSALVVLRRKQQPWLLSGWFWYLAMLLPVIGLVQAGAQVMADRYTYLPLIGIFIACVWSATELVFHYGKARWLLGTVTAVLLAGCCLATQKQVGYWRDNTTLFQHALAVTSRNPMAEWMVGLGYAERGQLGLAQTHIRLAMLADPYAVGPHLMLGYLFEVEERPDLAMKEYRTALRMKPQEEFAQVHLAGLLRKLGKVKEALAEYEEAVRWNPDSVEASYQAGALLLENGKLDRAGEFLENALQLKPDHADALLCLSDLRAQQKRPAEALAALQQVVRLYPTNFELRVNLGSLLWQAGRRTQAIAEYREAVRLNPAHPMVHYNLGIAFLAEGYLDEATNELSQAVRLKPDYAEALAALERARAQQK